MNLFHYFRETVLDAVGQILPGADTTHVAVEPPRDPEHGDVTSNAAMVLAKAAGQNPRELAAKIAGYLEGDDAVTAVEVAGPGFINLRLSDGFWRQQLGLVLREGEGYGASDIGGGAAVNVEYVSANPTGPLHIGHCRGAVFGDALANLLEKTGHAVTREYYINDAGTQIDVLGRSLYLRYKEYSGVDIGALPDDFYPGQYLKDLGKKLASNKEADGLGVAGAIVSALWQEDWLHKTEEEWLPKFRDIAVTVLLGRIKEDLDALGIKHDVFTSEKKLLGEGAVDEALKALKDKDLIYTGVLEPPKGQPRPDDWESKPQTLFRASRFGDDTDRVVKKADGGNTYFASDIAYHYDKYRRGFKQMINVWGADHGGYVKRMKAAVEAITDGEAELDIKLCQLVKLFRGGQPVRMSKRAGDFVTLREVVDEVGPDIVRFIMLTRRNDAPLDFDFEAVQEQSRENPVWYVQYSHARCASVMRNAADELPDIDLSDTALAAADFALLRDTAEIDLIKQMAQWPRIVESAALAHEPHRLPYFLYDLAGGFHALWNKGKENPDLRFIVAENPELSRARLAIVRGIATVIASGLRVMGVEPVEEM